MKHPCTQLKMVQSELPCYKAYWKRSLPVCQLDPLATGNMDGRSRSKHLLVVKVLMNDGSAKTLMVDERQTVREVLDNMFEKTHCDCNVDWSLCETNPELQLERAFEDHENLVEPLLAWTRDSENKVLFQERGEKYEVFKNPQNFYLWKKDMRALKDIKDQDKELLIQENFCGTSIIVPDLEGVMHLKEDGKKSWKPRLFQLRASGIYYVPKGKTKSSRDLVCFVQFDNLNIYYGKDFKGKYKAPTDFCFLLKHPQIQKESQYIKYLCCDDAGSMNLWVTGIRIAKYGASLYDNYKTAEKKAAVSSVWTNRSTPSSSNPSTPSPPIKAKSPGQANGHALKPEPGPVAQDFGHVPPPPPADILPPPADILPPPPPQTFLPPPPPPLAAKSSSKPSLPQRHLPTNFPPPPPAMINLPRPPQPPPTDDASEAPPDFLPPPPPAAGFSPLFPPPPPLNALPLPPPPVSFRVEDRSLPPPPPDPGFLPPPPPMFTGAGAPPPPPPPPPPPRVAVRPAGSVKKRPPAVPKRTTPSLRGGGGGDFMSELALAMNKKRSAH
ncbi:amyloid beta A4 precursor protein-binding family B member 1-interacting protein isoform X2 [Cyclopterus lumpus]|uniref:amyloid beta A4 precursor protein-binding family B member 1-interacting protein isoform X2 n=1 Tax=Cyclopterus lumpus TaxID=8103 RepID=UPI001487105D|nr:amyloid beta A4 precursor protein-binding family B member 1-interacting protein isoform X2 [Cyclopterus lumpus]